MAKKFTRQQVVDALNSTGGYIATAAEALGTNYRTLYNYVRDDSSIMEQVEHFEEKKIDFVESKLMQKINQGETASIHFYLQRKGKKRGYSIERESELNEFEPIQVTVVPCLPVSCEGGELMEEKVLPPTKLVGEGKGKKK